MTRRRNIQPLATVRRRLRRAMLRTESVRIERVKKLLNIYGFPLAIGKELVLLQTTVDFRVDGYTVLPLNQIAAVPELPTQRFAERVLRDSGRLERVKLPSYPLALDGWTQCATSLAATRKMIIIECELLDAEEENSFFLGPIIAVSNRALALHHIGADAEWFDNPEVISVDDITEMRFDDEYSKVFKRYAGPLPPDAPMKAAR